MAWCGAAASDFDFHAIYQALHYFCAVDLSAFYFDIRKDLLYCDPPDSVARRACRSVLELTFNCLTAWLAPILCFTTEEAWWARGAGAEDSIHLRQFPSVPESWRDDELAARWAKVREVRRVVTGALEVARAEKQLGSSLQAHPALFIDRPELVEAIGELDMAEITITSGLTILCEPPPADAFTLEEVPGVGVVVAPAEGDKCLRCWRVLPEVGGVPEAPGTCRRCADAVVRLRAAARRLVEPPVHHRLRQLALGLAAGHCWRSIKLTKWIMLQTLRRYPTYAIEDHRDFSTW